MSALGPLQVAVVARLKADAGFGALAGDRVYDGPAPEGTMLPFATLDSPTGVEEGGALGTHGFGHTFMLHAFHSDATGNKGVTEFATVCKAALRATLTVSGHIATKLTLEFETVLIEPNKRHMPMRFRVQTWET